MTFEEKAAIVIAQLRADRDRLQDALDKIRAEIQGIEINGQIDEHALFIRSGNEVKNIALDIINKYTAESEED